ncbi:hypothetical protein NQ317_004854 [Molorchus minor]|uniref:Large ribosomal subunit protein mL42 n=1 Tax=Molorchus minor TaxID=1323400 RepID=A0ABQ9J8Z6_9CUCU|nr:hypothetical protein NQ317_004854 [Molorchus minor]
MALQSLKLHLIRCNIFRVVPSVSFSTTHLQAYATASTDDGTTLVAWHPKTDFPYECTKALPETKIEESDSVLKTTLTPEVMAIFNKKTPEQARQELMNITHTTKHRWFPKGRLNRLKKMPVDREYL